MRRFHICTHEDDLIPRDSVESALLTRTVPSKPREIERRDTSTGSDMYSVIVQVLPFLIFPLYTSSFTIPTVNASSPFHPNIIVPSLGTLKINCYIQPLPPRRRLPDADLEDCYEALQYLLLGDKIMAPMQFSHDSRRGFHVPFVWGHQSCQIIINNIEPHAEDTFQTVLLAHLAAEVMEGCIVDTSASLGGDVKLGSRNQFELMVAGTA